MKVFLYFPLSFFSVSSFVLSTTYVRTKSTRNEGSSESGRRGRGRGGEKWGGRDSRGKEGTILLRPYSTVASLLRVLAHSNVEKINAINTHAFYISGTIQEIGIIVCMQLLL